MPERCRELFPFIQRPRCKTVRARHQRCEFLALAVLIVFAVIPQALGGPIILPPAPDNFALDTLPTIGANSSFVYSFNQNHGPLAYDFDNSNLDYASRTNTTPLTTAQYLFNGSVIKNTDEGSKTISLFAQFSPASNATGCFVPFLGFNANGNEVDQYVAPTKVANITDASGNQYGYILADYGATDPSGDNTTFTFVNTSPYAIDPTITGEQVGITIPEQFTSTAPTVTPASGTNGLTYGPATNVNGGGFNVSGIQASTSAGKASTLTLTATEGFKVINTSATNTLTMTAGFVTVNTTNPASTFGGSGSVSAQATIKDVTAGTTFKPIQVNPFSFGTTGFSQIPQQFSFSSRSASQGLTLIASHSYSATVTWTVAFTPKDAFTYATVDPNVILYSQPLVATPAPPTWVMAVIAVVCLGSFQLVLRRTRSRPSCPLAA